MKIVINDSYKAMSEQAANDLVEIMDRSVSKLVCLASGDTPSGVFEELVNRQKSGSIDVSQWKFVGLDEWGGMNGADEGSCRYHINKQFFDPLHISEDSICFFDGRANLQAECRRTEDFIKRHNGIDVVILGLGLNGHVGMNEPGASLLEHSHVAAIDEETQRVGQKYFSSPHDLSQGITLGLGNIMESRQVILLVSGAHKANIVKRIIEGEASENVPASLLRSHPSLTIYLDKEAAQLLNNTTSI
jgi:glucosamine-6-phosphate isomerase